MRLASLGAGFALLMALGACGDDDGGTPDSMIPPGADARIDSGGPDAGTPDAGPITFFNDEGGEVRFEYVRLANGNASARVIAFLKGDDDVDFHDYPALDGSCTLMIDDTKWPTTDPMNADYLDVGTLTVTNGTQSLTVPKATIDSDPLQRTHGAGNWYYKPAGDDDAAMYITEKNAYDVVFGGSATFPATTFEDAIYIPADFDITDPGPAETTINLEADTALDVNWNVVDSMAPTWSTPAWVIVGFIDADDGAVAVCVETSNDGNITVPAAMVNMIRTAGSSGGTMIRQVLHHNVKELEGPGVVGRRRIDMIGVWCWAYPFAVI